MRALHGGNIYNDEIQNIKNICSERFLDFSANINPLGIPERVRAAAVAAMDQAVHYPDPFCRKLRAALADEYGLPPETFICGNGGI